ncbi:MAG TPA: hypothetical protein VLT82_14605 [Myxococcaceae bacterium]|nr:hypothetical protein [Myxococcaceae bacterium]
MTCARGLRSLLAVAALLATGRAAAQDAFEIQVYDAVTAGPLEPGLEIHLNHFFQGTTEPSSTGEVPTEHLTHLTFEPHLGLTSWWELGLYLQTVLRPDGGWDSGGVKLRTKFRWPENVGAFRFALNIEVSRTSKRYEADGWGSELRPIVDARWGRWYLSVNPIIGIPLAGEDAWKPDFEPATKVSFDLSHSWAVGIETYSSFGQFGNFLPWDEQTHRLFAVVDAAWGWFALNLGVGYGTGPEKWIVKAILTFTPPEQTPEPPQPR